MPSYKLLPAARSDLTVIWRYTAKEWGATQADRYTDQLAAAFPVLAQTPLMHRERSEFDPPIRLHHEGHHLIVYAMAGNNGIVIIRILHERMELSEHITHEQKER